MKYSKINLQQTSALFIIALIISLPFYSAQALAANVNIVKNEGEKALPGYIDGAGDMWKVQAKIVDTAGAAVSPEQVKIQLGSSSDTFQSCSEQAGGYLCDYINDLSDGAVEDTYTFTVTHLPSGASDSDAVKADASAPEISGITRLEQIGPKIMINFRVEEQPSFGTGLGKIEILDADSGEVLQSINSFAAGNEKVFEYGSSDFNGELQAPDSYFTGEGYRRVKIRAEDKFGHSVISAARSLKLDFVAPNIVANSLNFTGLGEMEQIGPFTMRTNMVADVIDTGSLQAEKVLAMSDSVEFLRSEADSCELDSVVENLWHCTWNEVKLSSVDSLSVLVRAEDESGNSKEMSLAKSFTRDAQAPSVSFFGTDRLYDGRNFIKSGENNIILQINEQGAGMDPAGVRANLGAVGSGNDIPGSLDICGEREDGMFQCNWTVMSSLSGYDNQIVRIGLTKLVDKVENAGELAVRELVVDSTDPIINPGLEIKALSARGEKDYFESGDKIMFKLNVTERNGLLFKVDLNNVVNDALTLYPAGLFNKAGFEVFTESSCQRQNQYLICQFVTRESLKSEAQNDANIKLELEDSAGNKLDSWVVEKKERATLRDPRSGSYNFKKLAVEDEPKPDQWETRSSRALIDFVDLDAAVLFPVRMPVSVTLGSTTGASALEIDLQDCAVSTEEGNVGPELSQSLLYGGKSAGGAVAPTPTILLEFAPFDGRSLFGITEKARASGSFTKATAKYVCNLLVYSKTSSNKVLVNAEVQQVVLEVSFGFSELGAMDENLEGKIANVKDDVLYKIADKLEVLSQILTWVQYAARFVQLVTTIYQIINPAIAATDTLKSIPIFGLTAAAGACATQEKVSTTYTEIVSWFQIPLAILSCNPDPDLLGWYGTYQNLVLDGYNYATLRFLSEPLKAKGLYENMYTSLIGVCLPGIIYNLEKYRQVKCREIICYKNDVPAGLATIDSCQKLGKYLTCVFFLGPALSASPIQLADALISFVKGLFTSPMGLVNVALQLVCLVSCAVSGSETSVCNVAAVILKIGDLAETLVGAYNSWPSKVNNPYCSQIEDEEEPAPEEDTSVTTADAQAATDTGATAEA
ncbi:hypothetical protein J4437_03240 [Candidatus Woesearchaeota archaeon]|nr:hypothetical protein [Candidatus Woesearchaeota archaeon]